MSHIEPLLHLQLPKEEYPPGIREGFPVFPPALVSDLQVLGFESIKEAAKQTGVKRDALHKRCAAGLLEWVYVARAQGGLTYVYVPDIGAEAMPEAEAPPETPPETVQTPVSLEDLRIRLATAEEAVRRLEAAQGDLQRELERRHEADQEYRRLIAGMLTRMGAHGALQQEGDVEVHLIPGGSPRREDLTIPPVADGTAPGAARNRPWWRFWRST